MNTVIEVKIMARNCFRERSLNVVAELARQRKSPTKVGNYNSPAIIQLGLVNIYKKYYELL